MHLHLSVCPSRHNRDADLRAALKQAILDQLGDERPMKRLYKTTITLYGNFFKANGMPTERDTNNIVVVLFDALADAFWNDRRKGIGDCLLDREFAVKAYQSAIESIEVELE